MPMPASAADPPVAALLLAAGLSTRMGRPKPLLPWGEEPLVVYQVRQLAQAGAAPIIVVTGHARAAVEAALRDTGAIPVFNAAYAAGRAGSVRVGARAVPDDTAVLVLGVDQPRPAAVARALIAAYRAGGAAITVPLHAGRRGHPVLFAPWLLPELQAVTEAEEGLRAVLRAHARAVHEHPMDDPRVLLDLNTPEDYREALARFGPRA
jgi:molybdenum cofactor cytidylyltransferase